MLAAPSRPAGADGPSATWTQLSPATSPSGRYAAAMAYDPATGTVVLFGGNNGSSLSDTWTWDGSTWTQHSPATSPPARQSASMAYDPATGNMVLFGGYNGNVDLSDTWTWDGSTWTHLSPATSPSARLAASMAYDPAAGTMVLFGGLSNGTDLSDTWTWNGTTWTHQSPATSPSGRYGASMDYDPAAGNMVLFGGYGGSYLSETWTWNGTTWTQQSPATSPSGRQDPSMAYDPAAATMVLFGGYNNNSGPLSDTWTWDGTTWTQQSPATSPGNHEDQSMAYDAATDNMVLFGGYNGSYLSDTWIYQLTPTTPTISNLPASGTYGGALTATVATNGDGTQSVTSSAPSVCTASGLTVTYVGVGTCTLIAHVGDGSEYAAADGSPQSFTVGSSPIVVSAVSPATGLTTATTLITITGSGFTGATGVAVGGVPATGVMVVNDSTVTATAPTAASAGSADVIVSGPTSTSAPTPADVFTYTVDATPTVVPCDSGCTDTAATPLDETAVQVTGPPAAGAQVSLVTNTDTTDSLDCGVAYDYPSPVSTLTASGFSSSATLSVKQTVGGVPSVSGVKVCFQKSNGTIKFLHTCGTPKVAPCLKSLTEAPGNKAVAKFIVPANDPKFRLVTAPPTLTSFSPAKGNPGSSVTITGTNLEYVSAVVIAGAQAGVTSATPTTLVVTVPANLVVVPPATSIKGYITLTADSGSVVSLTKFKVK